MISPVKEGVSCLDKREMLYMATEDKVKQHIKKPGVTLTSARHGAE